MSDSNSGQIVFIVCLLGVFFTMVMTMPSEFYVVAPQYAETEFKEYWDIGDIQAVVNADEQNITVQSTWHYFEVENAIGDFIYVSVLWNYDEFKFVHHNWGFLGTGKGNIEPYPLAQSVVNASVDEDTGNFSRFLMTCDHHNYIVYFANNGDYASLSDALDDDTVGLGIGVDYDYETSVLSGLDIITRLLSLQLPMVTEEISFLIGIPIYTLIGVLAFIIITMVVGMLPFT